MAVITDIADAVVKEINDGDFSAEFTAQRLNLPEFDLAEMDTLHVTVVPKGVKETYLSRSAAQMDFMIDIGVMQRFKDQADQDSLLGLVEAIRAYFRLRRLSQYPAAVCVGSENDPVYDPAHMREKRQFTSVLTLTFRVVG